MREATMQANALEPGDVFCAPGEVGPAEWFRLDNKGGNALYPIGRGSPAYLVTVQPWNANTDEPARIAIGAPRDDVTDEQRTEQRPPVRRLLPAGLDVIVRLP